MELIKTKTNLHCERCVEKIKPHLDNDQNISDWSVNTEVDGMPLSVKGNDLSLEYLDGILNKEGYGIVNDSPLEKSKTKLNWSDFNIWRRASFNTLNCLIGCSIGDFGMIIYLQAYHPETSMLAQMILAINAGLFTSVLLETMILKYKEHFNWIFALKTAFGMSFISMVGMEIAMNLTDFMITGGIADFESPMYWKALIIAMIAGFIAPLPYNYYKLKKFDKACH